MRIKGSNKRNIGKWAGIGLAICLLSGIYLFWQSEWKRNSVTEFPEIRAEGFETLNIILDKKDLQKIAEKRQEALALGLLVTGPEDQVKAKVIYGNDESKAKIRLKGDWVDHLAGQKWSLRIELEEEKAWNKLLTFSIQSPRTRDFLNEWVFHELLRQEGILSTRYGFTVVKLNGENKGIYAWEEHFEKQIPESNQRREGPILKLAEDGLWNLRQREVEIGIPMPDHKFIMKAAPVTAFNTKTILADTVLKAQFLLAKDLLYSLIHSQSPPSQIIDPELTGKFLALCDISRTYHGLIWHNWRFYFNPITAKLEPIGFDGDTGNAFKFLSKQAILIQQEEKAFLVDILLNDPEIQEAYLNSLRIYSQTAFLSSFLDKQADKISSMEALLQQEFPEYSFDREVLFTNASNIAEMLKEVER